MSKCHFLPGKSREELYSTTRYSRRKHPLPSVGHLHQYQQRRNRCNRRHLPSVERRLSSSKPTSCLSTLSLLSLARFDNDADAAGDDAVASGEGAAVQRVGIAAVGAGVGDRFQRPSTARHRWSSLKTIAGESLLTSG